MGHSVESFSMPQNKSFPKLALTEEVKNHVNEYMASLKSKFATWCLEFLLLYSSPGQFCHKCLRQLNTVCITFVFVLQSSVKAFA